jgi:hypothetical protein
MNGYHGFEEVSLDAFASMRPDIYIIFTARECKLKSCAPEGIVRCTVEFLMTNGLIEDHVPVLYFRCFRRFQKCNFKMGRIANNPLGSMRILLPHEFPDKAVMAYSIISWCPRHIPVLAIEKKVSL